MRPEEAAQILDQLDDETLRVVFGRMETKQVAAIMASMSRERAVAFTKTLAADPDAATAKAR
jgi:flagellar motility protein MotE (MotC chaperone)